MKEFKPYVYEVYGLPISYAKLTYKDTQLISVKQLDIAKKIHRAPTKGLLAIQGCAGAVVNQLLETKKVRGIDFLARSSAAFDVFSNPSSEVIVLYNVGSEVSTNHKVSGLVLLNIVKHYSNKNTLLVIETNLTKADLLSRYDLKVTNFIKILPKLEDAWV